MKFIKKEKNAFAALAAILAIAVIVNDAKTRGANPKPGR